MATNARVTQAVVEALILPNPDARVTQVAVEALIGPQDSSARVTQVAIEALITNPTTLGGCAQPWTMPSPNPFPTPGIGGPQYKRFQEREHDWGLIQVKFPDNVVKFNTIQTAAVRIFEVEYDSLDESQARQLDNHYISTRGAIGFTLTVPRTGEVLTNVRYSSYDVPRRLKKWAQVRRMTLIKYTN